MTEFDELLDSILHQDANPHAPAHMTQRIVALVEQDAEHTRDRKSLWTGAAAAVVVLGVASWTFTHTRTTVQPARPASAIAQVPLDNFHHPADVQAFRAHPGRRRSIPARLERTATSPVTRPLFAQHEIQIAPLHIDPIDVQPIEIATVTQSTSITKGTP